MLVTEDSTEDKISWAEIEQRFMCHLIVSRLPVAALPELDETLPDMYEHYVPPPAKRLNLPEPPRLFLGTVGSVIMKPRLRLEQE